MSTDFIQQKEPRNATDAYNGQTMALKHILIKFRVFSKLKKKKTEDNREKYEKKTV